MASAGDPGGYAGATAPDPPRVERERDILDAAGLGSRPEASVTTTRTPGETEDCLGEHWSRGRLYTCTPSDGSQRFVRHDGLGTPVLGTRHRET